MILQWATILVLTVLVLSLMRQLGELAKGSSVVEEKRNDPFTIFHKVPEHTISLVGGSRFTFGGDQSAPCLIVFFSPTCGACAELPAAVLEFVKKHPAPEFKLLAVLKQIEPTAVQKYISERSLDTFPIAMDDDFPKELNPGGAPFGAAIAKGGRVAAQGKPKVLLHLLEMARAAENIIHNVPDHSRRSHEWGDSAPYWMPEQIGGQPAHISETVTAEARA
jgi:hypothetical protein